MNQADQEKLVAALRWTTMEFAVLLGYLRAGFPEEKLLAKLGSHILSENTKLLTEIADKQGE